MEDGQVSDRIEGECQICDIAAAKYRCPGCNRTTCSVECIRKHKEQTGCLGRRPRPTTYIPQAALTPEDLLEDHLLLTDASLSADRLSRILPTSNTSAVPGTTAAGRKRNWQWLKGLQKFCREQRNIQLSLMPEGMERASRNESRFCGKDTLQWTIEWILLDMPANGEHPGNLSHSQLRPFHKHTLYSNSDEKTTLRAAYEKLSKTSKDHSLPDFDQVEFLLRQEADVVPNHNSQENTSLPPPITITSTTKPWPIPSPSTMSIEQIVSHRTIIEFPTIYIHQKRH